MTSACVISIYWELSEEYTYVVPGSEPRIDDTSMRRQVYSTQHEAYLLVTSGQHQAEFE